MISAEQARELLAQLQDAKVRAALVGQWHTLEKALQTVIAQAEQITTARDHINDLQAWGQLEPAAAAALLALLAEARP